MAANNAVSEGTVVHEFEFWVAYSV